MKLLNPKFWKSIQRLIKTIDSPIKLSALIVILTLIMFVVLLKIQEGDLDSNIIYAFTIICVLIILGAFVKEIINPKKSIIENIDEGIFEIYKNKEAPAAIWQNFHTRFYSFNDSWIMELKEPHLYLETHKERYKDPNCGAFNFLFFIKDNNIDPFERFVKFQAMVHLDFKADQIGEHFKELLRNKINGTKLPDTLNYIYVYLNNDIIPRQTFFIGLKDSESTKGETLYVSIWYLALPEQNAIPGTHRNILTSTNEDFWDELYERWDNLSTNSTKILGKNLFSKYLEISSKEGEL